MQDKARRAIETAANISIIAAATLGAFILLKDHILTNHPQAPGHDAGAQAADKRETLVGRTVSLPDVDWSRNGQTLVIVLAKGCHYCTESAPFYKRIAATAGQRKDLQVVAVFPQEVQEAREYLEQIEVPIVEIRQLSPGSLGVRGTPTLLLVDKAGVIKDAWLGRLQPEKEAELLKEVACQGCG